MDSQIFWRELYPSLNVIQPKEPQDPNNPQGFNQYLTGLTDEEKKFVARQNLLTKQQRAWNLRKQVDGKGAEKSTFFVDHEINEPTEIHAICSGIKKENNFCSKSLYSSFQFRCISLSIWHLSKRF